MQYTPAISIAFSFGLLLGTPAAFAQSSVYQSGHLTKLWETKPTLRTPHSVVYDAARQSIYVCNEARSGGAGDGRGFVSRVSRAGEIVDLEWVTGLVEPKDMALRGDRLYVSGSTELIEVDVEKARVRGRYLNDTAVDLKSVVALPSGAVYVADKGADRVFELKDGIFGEFIKDSRFDGASGMVLVDKELFASVRNRVVAVDLKTQGTRTVFRAAMTFSGLAAVGDGTLLAVDFGGGISRLGRDGSQTRLLAPSSAAQTGKVGICYVKEERLLLISAAAENKLVAYHLD